MKTNLAEITEVRIVKMRGKGNLLGYANVVIGNSIALKGIRIIETEEIGKFIVMPGRKNLKTDKPKFYSHFHPISKEMGLVLKDAVLEAYENTQDE